MGYFSRMAADLAGASTTMGQHREDRRLDALDGIPQTAPRQTVTTTPTMRSNADALLMRAPHWPRAYDRNDVVIGYSFRSSRTLADGTPVHHLTRIAPTISCSCEGWQHRQTCAHSVAVQEYEARHHRTVETARARYSESVADRATTWRQCVRQGCETLIAPEAFGRFCDPCAEKNARLLARAFGEE